MATTESTASVRSSVKTGSTNQGRTPDNYKKDWKKIGQAAPKDWGACGSKAT